MLLTSLALIVSGLACIWDVREGVIPNWLSYLGLFIAILFSILDLNRTFSITLIGFLIGFSIPFLLFLMGRLGGGDVKLLAALGAALGFPVIVDLLLWTCVFGFLVGIAIVVLAGKLKELVMDCLELVFVTFLTRSGRSSAPVKGLSLPLAVAIFMAVVWVVFFPEYSCLIVL